MSVHVSYIKDTIANELLMLVQTQSHCTYVLSDVLAKQEQ